MPDTVVITPIIQNSTIQVLNPAGSSSVNIQANNYPQTIDVLTAQGNNLVQVQSGTTGQKVIEVAYQQGETGKAGTNGTNGVGIQGIQGITGLTGATGGVKTYLQSVPASTWAINHRLGFFPNVTTVTSAGDKIEGDIKYLDLDNLTVSFSSPLGGSAYLS